MDATLATVIVSGLGYGTDLGIFIQLGFGLGSSPPPPPPPTGESSMSPFTWQIGRPLKEGW